MSPQRRALIIGMLGPVISAFGVFVIVASAAAGHDTPDTFREVIFEPAHLVLLAGIIVSFITVPVALEVRAASAEEVLPHVFEPESARIFETDDGRGFGAAEH